MTGCLKISSSTASKPVTLKTLSSINCVPLSRIFSILESRYSVTCFYSVARTDCSKISSSPRRPEIHRLPSRYRASMVDGSQLLPIVFTTRYLPLPLSITWTLTIPLGLCFFRTNIAQRYIFLSRDTQSGVLKNTFI